MGLCVACPEPFIPLKVARYVFVGTTTNNQPGNNFFGVFERATI
jgi:hypothetical protein